MYPLFFSFFSNVNDVFMYTIGYLCGQCLNGRGVSALLNNCVSCGMTSVLLIIALGRLCVFMQCIA